MKKIKCLTITLLVFALLLTQLFVTETVSAGSSYKINGTTIPFSSSTSDGVIVKGYIKGNSYNGSSGCRALADYAYYKIWGIKFSRTDEKYIVSGSKGVTLNETNIKELILKSSPGAAIRVDKNKQWDASDSNGHSMILAAVDKDEKGFTVYHADSNGKILGLNHYTWSEFVKKWSTEKKYKYIKYIKSPGLTLNGKNVKSLSASVKIDSKTSAKITWNKWSGISGYEVYRSTSKSGTYEKIATLTSSSKVSYSDTGLSVGYTYYYKVRAYRTINSKKIYSEFTSISSVTFKPSSTKAVAAAVSKNSIKITWDKVPEASGYVVYRATSKNGTYKKIYTATSANKTSYKDTGLTTGKTYYYKVVVYTTVNVNKTCVETRSEYSSVVYAKPEYKIY